MQLASASFSGHESFPFRNTWLTKGVEACAGDPTIFGKYDTMVALGVGKNMVQSIRHWCLATRMIEEDPHAKNNRGRHLRPTILGRNLFLADGGWDPYLEDTATLWLLHWLLATSGEKATNYCYLLDILNQSDEAPRIPKDPMGLVTRSTNSETAKH